MLVDSANKAMFCEATVRFHQTVLEFEFHDGSKATYPFSEVLAMYRNGNGNLVVMVGDLDSWVTTFVTQVKA